MKIVYFSLPFRKSVPNLKLEYGQVEKKFIVRTFYVEINGTSTDEESLKEEVFVEEQEMMKKVNEIKKGLFEARWVIQNEESISQPSFLKTEIIDGAIWFKFSVDLDPEKLKERKKGITKDFLEYLDKEIETNVRKGLYNEES